MQKQMREDQLDRRNKFREFRQQVEEYNRQLVKARRWILKVKAANKEEQCLASPNTASKSPSKANLDLVSPQKKKRITLKNFNPLLNLNNIELSYNDLKLIKLTRLEKRLTNLISLCLSKIGNLFNEKKEEDPNQ